MKKPISCLTLASLIFMFLAGSAAAYEIFGGPTQLIQYNAAKAFTGYTLFASGNKAQLIDMKGNLIHQWSLPDRGLSYAVLLPNGNILSTYRKGRPAPHFNIGGVATGLVELDWDSKIVWQYELFNAEATVHHDFEKMPNGNVLVNVWERVSKEEAVKAGRDPKQTTELGVVYDAIYEINPKGEVVWKWKSWDHKGKGPDQLDVNFINYVLPQYEEENQDWTHFNDCDYNPATDQIMVDSREFGEFYIIDHKTGKILKRWGNPSVYGKGKAPTFTTPGDQILFGVHDAHWIKPGLPGAGNVLLFNNGWGRPPITYSSIIEMDPKTDGIVWEYKSKAETAFASHHISNSDRLPNGNTFICSGNWGHFFEVTKEGEVVWEYISPILALEGTTQCWMDDAPFPPAPGKGSNLVFRAHKYGPDYPGLAGKKLESKGLLGGDCSSAWKPRIK